MQSPKCKQIAKQPVDSLLETGTKGACPKTFFCFRPESGTQKFRNQPALPEDNGPSK
jgi:hypothetical protein